MPRAELVKVEGMMFVRTYDTLTTPVCVWCDYATGVSGLDWSWLGVRPDELPIPLRRNRYGFYEDARENVIPRIEFPFPGDAKPVRSGRDDVPCPKVRAGTEVRWENCAGYWQKWNKKKYKWEAI